MENDGTLAKSNKRSLFTTLDLLIKLVLLIVPALNLVLSDRLGTRCDLARMGISPIEETLLRNPTAFSNPSDGSLSFGVHVEGGAT